MKKRKVLAVGDKDILRVQKKSIYKRGCGI